MLSCACLLEIEKNTCYYYFLLLIPEHVGCAHLFEDLAYYISRHRFTAARIQTDVQYYRHFREPSKTGNILQQNGYLKYKDSKEVSGNKRYVKRHSGETDGH